MLKTLRNVEIFRVGKWKGFSYITDHLDAMVRNFQKFRDSWFRPAVKPGHGEKSGQEAAGYLDNLRRENGVLVADFVDLPIDIYNAIKQRKYDRVSIEIVPKLEREGEVYQHVVWSLALLGVEVPAVSGLKPLRAMLSSGTEVVSLETSLSLSGESGWDDFQKIIMGEPDRDDLLKIIMGNPIGPDGDLKKDWIVAASKFLYSNTEKEKKMSENHKDKKVNPPDPSNDKVDMSETILTLQNQVDTAKKQLNELSTKLDESTKYAHGLEEKNRLERVSRKVEELRLPALRPYAQTFYEWATRSDNKPIKFSRDGKESEMLPESVVDEFVSMLNKATESLLVQHSNEPVFVRDDRPSEDDPGAEVDRRTRELMSTQKGLDYTEAKKIVLEKDPVLKEQYALS